MKKRKPVIGLLISLLWITGYSVVYTYISPFLQETTGLSVSSVSFMLTVFGISGVFGSYIGGYAADKWGVPRSLFLSLILRVFALFALTSAAGNFVGAATILAIWAAAAWTTVPVLQYYFMTMAPASSQILLSLNSSTIHLGIVRGWDRRDNRKQFIFAVHCLDRGPHSDAQPFDGNIFV